MDGCIFCKIISGEIPSRIISKTGHSMAMLDAFPLARGHTLVIPVRHHHLVQDLPDDQAADLFNLAAKTAAKTDQIYGSTLISIHNGKDSGQEIPHVHIHLIPRNKDDGAGPVHSMFKNKITMPDEELDQLQKQMSF